MEGRGEVVEMGFWGRVRFHIHRQVMCRFLHRGYRREIPEGMREGYRWGWYCERCCGVGFIIEGSERM